MTPRQRRALSLASALLVVGAGAYALYSYLSKDKKVDQQPSQKYTKKPVTIVLTESILTSNIPINEILAKTCDVVVVVAPELSLEDLNEELDPSVAHKVIECETLQGVWSVVKHLNGEVMFIVKDDLSEDIPEGLERYVGEIVELEQNSTVINEAILSYVIS